jgi:hypothetical protein
MSRAIHPCGTSRSPALGALVEQRNASIRERDPGLAKQLLRLLGRETQIQAPNLGQLARQTQPMKAKPRTSRVANTTCSREGRPQQEHLEPPRRVRRIEFVQIVDDEHGRVIEKGKITQELVNRHVAAKPRSGIDALHTSAATPSASISESQNRCASRSPRSTDTHATRSCCPHQSTSAPAPSCRCRPARRPRLPRPDPQPISGRTGPRERSIHPQDVCRRSSVRRHATRSSRRSAVSIPGSSA